MNKDYGFKITWHPVGKLAVDLIERFGSVACVEDGEDSSGRSKSRLQTPDELVDRCIAIAEKFHEKAGAAGHTQVTELDADGLIKMFEEDRLRREGV